ncbi:sigma-70 family RNA polymerase sigma factor [bacterium]|nr:MAG: sigma-70 family RNA polymerase sigma factor [bacterium]
MRRQDLVDPAPAADEVLSSHETRALLDEALDALPYDLRSVFVLSELEELPGPDIAVLTGIPVGTVASRLRRAREEFQKVARRIQERESQKTRGHS